MVLAAWMGAAAGEKINLQTDADRRMGSGIKDAQRKSASTILRTGSVSFFKPLEHLKPSRSTRMLWRLFG